MSEELIEKVRLLSERAAQDTLQMRKLTDERDRARIALKDLFLMMDENILVRNTENDGDQSWAMKMLDVVTRLKWAHDSIDFSARQSTQDTHQERKLDDGPFKCPDCSAMSVSLKVHVAHWNLHHGSQSAQATCPKCGVGIHQLNALCAYSATQASSKGDE